MSGGDVIYGYWHDRAVDGKQICNHAVTAGLVVAVCYGVALVASVLRRRSET